MKIALTFDDGPSKWTGPVLDLLTENNAKATFFITGGNIRNRADADLCARIVNDGHEVGNHTMTHPDLTTMEYGEIRKELGCANLMIAAASGTMPDIYRPPYLRLNNDVHKAAGDLRLRPVGCNIIPGDWQEPSSQRIAEAVMDEAEDGSIVLLHDGRPYGQPPHAEGGSLDSRQPTVDAVAMLLPALIDQSFECVTVSELWRQ